MVPTIGDTRSNNVIQFPGRIFAISCHPLFSPIPMSISRGINGIDNLSRL